jgi:hypothetical protein
MKNKVYSAISIYGNDAITEKVNEWFDLLVPVIASDDSKLHSKKIFEVIFLGQHVNSVTHLDSIYYKGNSSGGSDYYDGLTFFFESALQLDTLQENFLNSLANVDPNVVIHMDYSIEEYVNRGSPYLTEGYRYILLDEEAQIYDNTQGSVRVQDLSASDDWETDLFDLDAMWNATSAHARLHPNNKATFLNEAMDELEYVTDLGNDYKKSKKYLKNITRSLKNTIKKKYFVKFD